MIGERIRQARLVSGLTQTEVVERLRQNGVSLTKAGLSKYERGGSTPAAPVVLALAKVLGVKGEFFFTQPKYDVEWLAFRKTSRLGTKEQERVKALACQVVERQLWLLELLRVSHSPRVPRYDAETAEDAEAAAERLRKAWIAGELPIESVTETIEDVGGIVVEAESSADGFHGLSGWAKRKHPVVVTSAGGSDDRRRFNLAHELGHLVLNCDQLPAKKQESLAHRFAAAFLVPSSVARRELGEKRKQLSLRELAVLKQKHGLSMQAWLRRAYDLEVISSSHYKALCMEFSRRGWRKKEPVDFTGYEMPVRFKQLTLRALAEGVITPVEAEEFIPGITKPFSDSQKPHPPVYVSAKDVLALPKKERERLMADAARTAAQDYEDPELTAFDAFGEDDLIDDA